MFSKLLKHKLRNQANTFSILSAAAIISAIIGSLMMLMLLMLAETDLDSMAQITGFIFSVLMLYAIALLLMAYSTAISIILYYNFYKQHFSDEGYLTFTLPATTHQHLITTIINNIIWSLAMCLVVTICTCIILSPIVFYIDWADIFQNIHALDLDILIEALLSIPVRTFNLVLILFAWFSSAAYSLIMPLVSITIGSLLVKKLKLLTSFGIMYGISMIVSVISMMLQILGAFGYFFIVSMGIDISAYVVNGLNIIMYFGLAIGGYFLMHRLINKNLNLN